MRIHWKTLYYVLWLGFIIAAGLNMFDVHAGRLAIYLKSMPLLLASLIFTVARLPKFLRYCGLTAYSRVTSIHGILWLTGSVLARCISWIYLKCGQCQMVDHGTMIFRSGEHQHTDLIIEILKLPFSEFLDLLPML